MPSPEAGPNPEQQPQPPPPDPPESRAPAATPSPAVAPGPPSALPAGCRVPRRGRVLADLQDVSPFRLPEGARHPDLHPLGLRASHLGGELLIGVPFGGGGRSRGILLAVPLELVLQRPQCDRLPGAGDPQDETAVGLLDCTDGGHLDATKSERIADDLVEFR